MPSNISSPRYLPALVVSLVNWVINTIISSSHSGENLSKKPNWIADFVR